MAGRLLLVPTSMERDRLIAESATIGGLEGWTIELCGFGVVAAATLTMRWLHVHQPDQVVLAGIAGSLDHSIEVGTACWFSETICDGIGVSGTDSNEFRSASELGWHQIEPNILGRPIGDRLELVNPQDQQAGLLTVCAASADSKTATRRRDRFDTDVTAEDMEGFAVAVACQVHGVALSIVRGISNHAGDRNHEHWDIDGSLRSVASELLLRRDFFSG